MHPFNRPRFILSAATGWWLLVALTTAVNATTRGGESGWAALSSALVAVAAWIPLTYGIFVLVQRYPFQARMWRRPLVMHCLGAMLVVCIRALYIFGLDPLVHFYPQTPHFSVVLLHSVENNLFAYWLFVGAFHALIYARESMERGQAQLKLEAALAKAQLAALTATVHPHFLFNTLGAIAELVHQNPAAADRGIVQLSSLLRRLIDDERLEVSFREELDFTRDYVAIEQMRFGARLAVIWEIAPELLTVSVPRLSVQPLVENALRHGLWPLRRSGVLRVAAALAADGRLVVQVTDDGTGLAAALPERGLKSVRARLKLIHGAQGNLLLRPNENGGASAELVVPT